eukprot:jgi/Undpi1/490/HiC_scaffold_10.g03956.m1
MRRRSRQRASERCVSREGSSEDTRKGAQRHMRHGSRNTYGEQEQEQKEEEDGEGGDRAAVGSSRQSRAKDDQPPSAHVRQSEWCEQVGADAVIRFGTT